MSFTIDPVGKVSKRGSATTIEIDRKYEEALLGLDEFSHVWVLWWFDRSDTPNQRQILRVHPRGDAANPLTGVFATRSPVRPNLVALSLCKIRSVEGRTVHLDDIDAFDKTPVIDLKPYLPGCDCAEGVELPAWVKKGKKN